MLGNRPDFDQIFQVGIQFKALHSYYKHIEDVHVTFCKKNELLTKFSTSTFHTLVFSIGGACWSGDGLRGRKMN